MALVRMRLFQLSGKLADSGALEGCDRDDIIGLDPVGQAVIGKDEIEIWPAPIIENVTFL